jgi:hypothetical protein
VNRVLSGYRATSGYDLVTGLGTVNAANLVNNWDVLTFQPSVSKLTLNPTSHLTHGAQVTVNVPVTASDGIGTLESGIPEYESSKGPRAGSLVLNDGAVASTTNVCQYQQLMYFDNKAMAESVGFEPPAMLRYRVASEAAPAAKTLSKEVNL